MGLDAEEGLAHDDKRRDVEDEVQGQIVEIQAIIEHDPPDEWVERESQSTEEVGEEHYPLIGPGVRMSCPSSGRYPALLSFLMSPSVTEESIHLPPAPEMVGEG